MVTTCCAHGCKAKWTKGGRCPYTFHSFPKDAIRSRQWNLNIRRANFTPTKYSKVCSKHFTQDCFDREKFGGTWLKANAVPTLFDFPPCEEKNTATKTSIKEEMSGGTSTNTNEQLSNKVWYLEYFRNEDIASPSILEKLLLRKQKKTGGKKPAQQQLPKPATQTTPPAAVLSFEPEIVIKEEPIDIDENQLPSTSRTTEEFILPESDWTPAGQTPALGEAFSLVKMDTGRKDKEGQSEKGGEDDSNNKTKDHFDAYGEYIAAKLRKLDWKSCAYVQKAIGDIIFDAEMGKYK